MTPDEERPVTLVLDRSAVLAYLAGSIHATEPVGEVIEDRQRFGITAVTVAEALALVTNPKDREDLHVLLRMDACAVLSTWGEDWLELSYWRGVTSRADLATTAMAALEHRASILTREGALYGTDGHLPVIYMPQ
ncbi:hypothetical protein ABZ807_17560 [Micromonospora sp. NPDC047548]|uniref:hypothetical protein n=1 Tax=Micromonospora sp. NPDC047548 TaxID=3155624 RepID=UPI0033C38D87